MLITDLIGAVWALLPEGLWWVLGVLALVVTVALRAEAH
jgi:hypothetical protein